MATTFPSELLDPTLRYLRETRAWATHLGSAQHATLQVSVKDVETGRKVGVLLCYPTLAPPCPLPEHPGDVLAESMAHAGVPELTPLQVRIVKALADKSMKGEALAAELGFAKRTSVYGPSGLRGLMAKGVVENDRAVGYQLTELGLDVAAEL